MTVSEMIQLNLLSPVILCFFLGIVATLVRSDMRFPEQLYHGLSIYLLLAIGLKGGVALVSFPSGGILIPLLAGFALSAAIPVWTYPVLRKVCRLSQADAAAIGAHYGSVSVVTFLAAVSFLKILDEPSEGFLPALVAIMEVPAIVVALLIARRATSNKSTIGESLHQILAGKSVFLLLGGLLIGVLCGPAGFAKVQPFFDAPFQGVLCLFLLEMGMVASRRFPDLRRVGGALLAFAFLIPVFHAGLALLLGQACGLSRGGSFLFAVLASSASYIAAPATVRLAIPNASPALYLTTALAITFPFNLTIGIPLYFTMAKWLFA